ncbi:hypothetical protein [Spirillospora sp. NPDC048823]|uniref:hypothetical protein n=1 Tax=unclassified Spirillospora TaxID=2642701 RepID=UPI003715244C
MRWPPWSKPDPDQALDAFLAAGDAELLNHVRTHADPTPVLAALLEEFPQDNQPDTTTTFEPAFTRPVLSGPAQQIRVRALVRDLDLELDRVRALVHDLTRTRDHEVARTRVRALVRPLNLARDLAGGVAGSLDLDLARTCARDRGLDLDRVCGLVRALDLVRVRAIDLERVRDLVLDRASEVVGALDRDFDIAHGLARDLARDLDAVLSGVRFLGNFLVSMEIDASRADLADLELPESSLAEVLVGVLWDRGTRWPPNMRTLIRARSKEIRPGVYRVQDGTERDPQERVGV